MISTSDFKKGIKILFRDEPYMVLDWVHVKPGKGGAFLRTKMKSMITGLVREETFRSGEKFSQPDLEYKDMQYLYVDGTLYNFMVFLSSTTDKRYLLLTPPTNRPTVR